LLAAPPALATARSTARTHVVGKGERLDTIAKHYRVTTNELRRVNDLRQGATVKAGQRLTIPNFGTAGDASTRNQPTADAEKSRPAIVNASTPSSATLPLRHRVTRGETLGQIAVRYATSVEKIASRNRLERARGLREGQLLTLPSGSKPPFKSWHPYAKPAKRKGYLELSTHSSRFSGPVVGSDGRLLKPAVRALNGLLGAGGSHPPLPERLIRLLVEVSDRFAGRPLRVVSGYRTASYYEDSRHKQSSAVDFVVVGVPNAIICEYLRELEDVGVGYYPNSSFVHLDVRKESAYWVDYSGPGEPPRSSPNAPRVPSGATRKLLAKLDSVLEQVTRAIDEAKAPTPGGTPSRAEHGAKSTHARLGAETHGDSPSTGHGASTTPQESLNPSEDGRR
jgi:LysM repeat protein